MYANTFIGGEEIKDFRSNKIEIIRGVRQADPLSALMFIASIEPILQQIEENKHAKPNPMAIKNDVLCYTKIDSLEALFDILDV